MKDPPCLKKALQGDRGALEEMVSACHAAVFGYLLRRTGSREKALDLSQDVMVRVLEGLDGYRARAGAGFMSWAFRIAHNRYVDSLRSTRTEPPPDEEPPEPSTGYDATSAAALMRMEAACLRQALSKLRSEDRELLELRYFFGFTHKETAEVLQVRPAVVKSRLNTALGRLRGLYANMEKGEQTWPIGCCQMKRLGR